VRELLFYALIRAITCQLPVNLPCSTRMMHPAWASELKKVGEYFEGFVKKRNLDNKLILTLLQHSELGDQETLESQWNPQGLTKKIKILRFV